MSSSSVVSSSPLHRLSSVPPPTTTLHHNRSVSPSLSQHQRLMAPFPCPSPLSSSSSSPSVSKLHTVVENRPTRYPPPVMMTSEPPTALDYGGTATAVPMAMYQRELDMLKGSCSAKATRGTVGSRVGGGGGGGQAIILPTTTPVTGARKGAVTTTDDEEHNFRNDQSEIKEALDRYHQLAMHETFLVQQLQSCDVTATTTVKNLGWELHAILSHKLRELKALVGDDNGEGVVGGHTKKVKQENDEEEEEEHQEHEQDHQEEEQEEEEEEEEEEEDLEQQQQEEEEEDDMGKEQKKERKVKMGKKKYKEKEKEEEDSIIPIKAQPVACPTPSSPIERGPNLHVDEQPTGNVVANKYLEPPLVVRVDDALLPLAREGRLQVSASLCLTLSDEPLSRTLDNKQDILQGHTVVTVASDGYATFSKLKIMEVSSKHHHQAFSIQLQLQQIANAADGSVCVVHTGENLKLAPLHVKSRINKRKRSSFSTTSSKPKKRARGESDCNYVDITPLLVLPQKEAASRLGISESMLCKRFKECTRRKWPYRYLRKIDKMIRVLTMSKKSESLPREDQEKIQRLKREREECLHPVKIRITGHDKNPTATATATTITTTTRGGTVAGAGHTSTKASTTTSHTPTTTGSTISSTTSTTAESKPASKCTSTTTANNGCGYGGVGSDSESEPTDSNSSPYEEEGDEEEEEYEEDEISQVASTLNLMKKGAL